jgi:hypothetical protein
MLCPGCRQEMVSETLDGHYGRTVQLDLCHACGALWFDGHESLTLAPGAILRLFARISEKRAERHLPTAEAPACPRCRRRLAQTADMQRTTRFSYWRCPDEHGRWITFAEFLREKHFVRPLSARELADLRANVKMVHCSGCGAPIDLERSSACGQCRAPVSILDNRQVEATVAELRRAEEKRRAVDPNLPARLAADRLNVEALFQRLDRPSSWLDVSGALGLVDAGLATVASFLSPNV